MSIISQGLMGLGARKESQAFNKESKKRTSAALGELTPEAMQKLISMFFSQYYGQMAPQLMGAQQGLASRLGRYGGTGIGVAEQLRAGLPGQFAGQALQRAFGSALPIAQQRAGIQGNREFKVGPSGLSMLGQGVESDEQNMMKMFQAFMGGAGGMALGGK